MSELKERCDVEQQYKWDLSTLFENDELFEESLNSIDEEINKLADYAGTLNNADAVLAFLQAETNVTRKMSNIINYASLRRSEDARDAKGQSMFARAVGKYINLNSVVAYAEPEILSLDEDVLTGIINDEKLGDFKFYLENLARFKAHTLTKEEELLLAQMGEVFSNPSETANALLDADLVFEPALDSEGVSHEVSSSSFILLETSSDRVLRENTFRSFYKSYKQHINTFASTYSGAVKGAVLEAKVRHYDSSRQASMFSDNIPESVYDNLISTVHNRMDVMYRYLSLRKRLLKLDELHYYDVYTPLVQESTKEYSYEEAKQLVLEAVAPLGNEYVERVKQAFVDRWVDVYPNKGKGSGAFSSGTYDSNPFISMNFTGTLDSVSTLAHEMGHSQHTWLTNHNQQPQNADYSLFVAEVASTVNENLLIEHLLDEEKDPLARLSLLNQYMEGFKGTVYRQTMFAEFEMKAHALAESGEPINAETLNNLYLELIKLYFGEDLVIDDEVQYEWARIPHFYSPFYVYVYATGYCSANAISQMILTNQENAVENYLEFLTMGGSAYPLEELKHAGVDLTTSEPIDIAIDKFNSVLEEADKIAVELGL